MLNRDKATDTEVRLRHSTRFRTYLDISGHHGFHPPGPTQRNHARLDAVFDCLWSLEEVAAAFKFHDRYRASVAAHLELLSDLSVIAKLEGSPEPQFLKPRAESA